MRFWQTQYICNAYITSFKKGSIGRKKNNSLITYVPMASAWLRNNETSEQRRRIQIQCPKQSDILGREIDS